MSDKRYRTSRGPTRIGMSSLRASFRLTVDIEQPHRTQSCCRDKKSDCVSDMGTKPRSLAAGVEYSRKPGLAAG